MRDLRSGVSGAVLSEGDERRRLPVHRGHFREVVAATRGAVPLGSLMEAPFDHKVCVLGLQVNEAGLESYLQQKRAEGYTLLGVEQTSGSTLLDQFIFSTKCLLLLGTLSFPWA